MKRVEQATSSEKAANCCLGLRVAVDADQLARGADPVGHQARVAAGAERAVDRDLAGRGIEQVDQLAGQHGDVDASCQEEVSPAPPDRRLASSGTAWSSRASSSPPARAVPDLDRVEVPDQHHLAREPALSISACGSMIRPAASSWASNAPAV